MILNKNIKNQIGRANYNECIGLSLNEEKKFVSPKRIKLYEKRII